MNRRQRRAQRRQGGEVTPLGYLWELPGGGRQLRLIGYWDPIPEPWWLDVVSAYELSKAVDGQTPRHDYTLTPRALQVVQLGADDGRMRIEVHTPEYRVCWAWRATGRIFEWLVAPPVGVPLTAATQAAIVMRPEVMRAAEHLLPGQRPIMDHPPDGGEA